jgi:hypothetical protein
MTATTAMPRSASTLLRVLLTSTSYPATEADWRGVFIRHMVAALGRRDDLALSVWAPPGPIPPGVSYVATPRERDMLVRLMAEGGVAHLLRNHRFQGMRAALGLLHGLWRVFRQAEVDVYHVNWLQCLLPLPSNGVPLLVTVLGNDMNLLKLPGMPALLRRAMRGRKVTICPNATWMKPHLEALFGDIAKVVPTPFGIGPHWYGLQRTLPERAEWLVVTRLTRRKLGPIFDWGQGVFGPGTTRKLHLLGPMQETIDIPSWVDYHGVATPAQLHETWFPRATGVITLSEHDEGRPQLMLEAMAAGLPIIASRLAAHVDLIDDGVDGAIVDDRGMFIAGLDALEVPATNHAFGSAAREKMRATFGTWDDCAARYDTLYRAMAAGHAHG